MTTKTNISKSELRLRSVTKGRRSEWKDFSSIQLINYSINQLFEKGHEHLRWFGLVNMNARLYDAAVGRFLSPDPYVHDFTNSQDYNRYSYARNNPLIYTDKSGEDLWFIAGIVFIYCMLAHENRDQRKPDVPANWAWNPLDWLKSTLGNPNPTGIVVTVGGSPGGGGYYGSVSVGNPGGPMPTLGYHSEMGFGFGHNYYGNNYMYYPYYNPSPISMKMPERPKWSGSYFQGTEEEARQMLIYESKLFGIETAMWYTSRGYYFEPYQGTAYASTTNNGMISASEVGYYENTIRTCAYYTYYEINENGLNLVPSIFQRSIVSYRAHTHPRSSFPSDSDKTYSQMLGYSGVIYGWDGKIYKYNGFDPLVYGYYKKTLW